MKPRAIMVCVNYEDLLAVTLPYNRHHFEDVCIVTDSASEQRIRDLILPDAPSSLCEIKLFVTDAFYERGAAFNKWLALERALDWYGRHGWLCVMDADVLWPRDATIPEMKIGELLTPLRRMAPWPFPISFPPFWYQDERTWGSWPLHRNVGEWAGYTQIFRAEDPAIGPAPWHETDWRHAGGADSIFQRKWSNAKKIRPKWEVLHLGEAGQNWFGRATPMGDGTVLPGSDARLRAVADVWARRAELRRQGVDEAGRFRPERLG